MDTQQFIRAGIFFFTGLMLLLFPKHVRVVQLYIIKLFHLPRYLKDDTSAFRYIAYVCFAIGVVLVFFAF